jgi:hypothetical protein
MQYISSIIVGFGVSAGSRIELNSRTGIDVTVLAVDRAALVRVIQSVSCDWNNLNKNIIQFI